MLLRACEDLFERLPVHWMWWPALGVGYDVIAGRMLVGAVALVSVVSAAIRLVALFSGTSGGLLAPLLILGSTTGWLIGVASRAVGAMLSTDRGRLAVSDPATGRLVGIVTRKDNLQIRAGVVKGETERSRPHEPRRRALARRRPSLRVRRLA